MSSAQDPFYIVKEEIQDSIDKLQSNFHRWEAIPPDTGEQLHVTKDILATCDSIDWQVATVKKAVVSGKDPYNTSSVSGARRELMRLPNTQQSNNSNQYNAYGNDDFITSESDRQMLLMKQQDEELDEVSAIVERIGGVGLTIHEELLAQEKIIDELGTDMDSTSNRLDFVQKKVAIVMKKAGAKGQIMMILFLVALFIVLFVLVFFT